MRKRFLSLLLVLACVLTLAVVPVIAAEPDPVQPSAPTTEPSAPATEPTAPTAPTEPSPEPTPEPTPVKRGWQTEDGVKYYYSAAGERVTGTQVIDGTAYRFTPGGALMGRIGIDVSEWQANVDWQKVRASGVSYVILRLGFRGYGTGRLVLDSSFRKNIEGARAAGLQVGVYFFSQAVNEKEAIEEASMCVQYVQGYQVDMPIFIDLEDVWDPDDGSGGRANNLSVSQRTSVARAFCDTVRSAGYKAGIYASYYYLLDRMHIGQLEGDNYIWMASYADSTGYPRGHDMWQYTDNGRVPGITTWDGKAASVDMNVWYE